MLPLDVRAFVASLPAFAAWPEAQASALVPALDDLADRCQVWAFEAGDVVRFPDEAPGPTWVAEGCLVVLYPDGIPRYVGVREAVDQPAGPWVRGQTTGRLVTVAEASWRDWLTAWPRVAEALGEAPPTPLPRSLQTSPLVLEPGEVPTQVFRKSRLFLALRSLVPGAFFLAFLAFGVAVQVGFGDRVPAVALWALPGLGLAVTAGLLALMAWEWSTSVLVVTDRSILVRQIDVWTHRSDFEKLALERVREAVFTRSGWVATLFRLVDLEVEGDSPRGRLVFRGLARDSRFLATMEALRARRKAAPVSRRVIRQALADRHRARAPRLERDAEKVPRAAKVRRLGWRVERSGAVWFRRHPWVLAGRCLPWVGWVALVGFLAAFALGLWPQGGGPIALVAGALALVPLGRLGWEIWDWSNDRLSLQGPSVVLVHKKPLGLGEVRQQGDLAKVEQVGVRKATLAALVFDYGTVTIHLGGGEPLVFDHAHHPEWVQNEIFHRRTLLAQDQERAAALTRLDEVTEILDTWDEARKAGYFSDPKD